MLAKVVARNMKQFLKYLHSDVTRQSHLTSFKRSEKLTFNARENNQSPFYKKSYVSGFV